MNSPCDQWSRNSGTRRSKVSSRIHGSIKKTDRARRLRENSEYIERYCPQLMPLEPMVVIDIGPGPGEFLEIARSFGNEVHGIDARTGDGGMGAKYLRYSELMTDRQELSVDYYGLGRWIKDISTSWHGAADLINSRGSIEQAMSGHMDGPPHDEHHKCDRLSWNEGGETRDAFDELFAAFNRMLRPGGKVLIHANGAANVDFYDELVTDVAEANGMFLELCKRPRLHRWVKK